MIDELTITSVSYRDGDVRKAYENSHFGREKVLEEIPQYAEEIFFIWGDVPTVNDPVYEVEEQLIPTAEERLEAIEMTLLELL
ncbi:MAG: hypothetical protein GX053_12605 [Tissierella sp.]|nr:hypothetical protein [Tissierella sp.]